MPNYTYTCAPCKKKYEIFQSIHEDRLTTCPTCRAETLRKEITAAPFVLKGSGFHCNDYGKSTNPRTSEHLKDPCQPDDQDLELIGLTREEYNYQTSDTIPDFPEEDPYFPEE